MIKLKTKTKKANAKLSAEEKIAKLEDALKRAPSREVPKPPTNGFSLKRGIGLFTVITEDGKAQVDVAGFNKAETEYTIALCKALGFNPQW